MGRRCWDNLGHAWAAWRIFFSDLAWANTIRQWVGPHTLCVASMFCSLPMNDDEIPNHWNSSLGERARDWFLWLTFLDVNEHDMTWTMYSYITVTANALVLPGTQRLPFTPVLTHHHHHHHQHHHHHHHHRHQHHQHHHQHSGGRDEPHAYSGATPPGTWRSNTQPPAIFTIAFIIFIIIVIITNSITNIIILNPKH